MCPFGATSWVWRPGKLPAEAGRHQGAPHRRVLRYQVSIVGPARRPPPRPRPDNPRRAAGPAGADPPSIASTRGLCPGVPHVTLRPGAGRESGCRSLPVMVVIPFQGPTSRCGGRELARGRTESRARGASGHAREAHVGIPSTFEPGLIDLVTPLGVITRDLPPFGAGVPNRSHLAGHQDTSQRADRSNPLRVHTANSATIRMGHLGQSERELQSGLTP